MKFKSNYLLIFFLLGSLSIAYKPLKKNLFLYTGAAHSLARPIKKIINPKNYEDEILGVDFFVRGRAYVSVIKKGNKIRAYYTKWGRFTGNKGIYMREASSLKDLSNAKPIKLIDKHDAKVDTQVWMPYVFKEKDEFIMIFTARSGDFRTDNYIENVRIARSDDGIKWIINPKPILIPTQKWEGREVENWGIIKKNDVFYMSYESTGFSRSQNTRSIGIAFSKDLNSWKRLKEFPLITGKQYCSNFFAVDKFIYKIVPNDNRFKVYKFRDLKNLSDNNFIGFWDPEGIDNKFPFDSPDLLTNDIKKNIEINSELLITYSLQDNEGWRTKYKSFKNIDDFLKNLNSN